jgi:hypothetical protein
MIRLNEYLNNKSKKEGGNLTVHGPYLWEEISKIRGGMPSMRYRTRWKFLSGCSVVKGKYPDIRVVVDGRHYVTPREAASIAMLALWEGQVRILVDPQLGSESITAEQIEFLFDRWMVELEAIDEAIKSKTASHEQRLAKESASKAEKLLKAIETSQQMTYDLLEAGVNPPGKKPIPQTTLRGWVEKLGGKFRKGEPCPLHIAASIWAMAEDRRSPMKDAVS